MLAWKQAFLPGSAMESTTLEPGTLVDHRYVIRRFIAAGGVAELYAATHKLTGQEVALKLPRSDRLLDTAVHDRLLREAEALARARHPGVVEVLDLGRHGQVPYLVLELIGGRTLGGLLAARARLRWEEAVAIGMRVAEILGHCHSRGVIHRDLKPDNLFATSTTGGGVKLFDFGIARLVDTADSPPVAKLTQVGSIVGTPEYMAPEALELEAGQDHRVDIYGFGVVMFELLTGAVPFEGRYAEVLVQVSTKPLPSLAALCPEAPAALAAVVEKCLARSADDRYSTMMEVSAALAPLSVGLADPRPTGAPAAIPSLNPRKSTLADTPAAISMRSQPGEVAPPTQQTPTLDIVSVPPAPLFVAQATGKRRFPRAPYTTPAQLTLQSGTVAGQIEEISEGGVQFIATHGIPSGERGEFRFAEPITGRICRITAVARWTKTGRGGRHATGFEFQNTPEEVRQSVRKYVELMGGN
jgi:eukaryotic-like serine/threonine-protein kinase